MCSFLDFYQNNMGSWPQTVILPPWMGLNNWCLIGKNISVKIWKLLMKFPTDFLMFSYIIDYYYTHSKFSNKRMFHIFSTNFETLKMRSLLYWWTVEIFVSCFADLLWSKFNNEDRLRSFDGVKALSRSILWALKFPYSRGRKYGTSSVSYFPEP